jgi:hypothetical protein
LVILSFATGTTVVALELELVAVGVVVSIRSSCDTIQAAVVPDIARIDDGGYDATKALAVLDDMTMTDTNIPIAIISIIIATSLEHFHILYVYIVCYTTTTNARLVFDLYYNALSEYYYRRVFACMRRAQLLKLLLQYQDAKLLFLEEKNF